MPTAQQNIHGYEWRPTLRREPSYGDFRTCGYCGSIHPADLVHYLLNPELNVTMHGCDWKYGYPHKFYVEGIPNLLAGQTVTCGSTSGPVWACPQCETTVEGNTVRCRHCQEPFNRATWVFTGIFDRPIRGTGPKYAFAKFYSEHLQDVADQPLFATLTERIFALAHIQFFLNEAGDLSYRAPRYGYQA